MTDDTLMARSPHRDLREFLAAEHVRLDELLAQATDCLGKISNAAYEGFRETLLRHIRVEEKILFQWLSASATAQRCRRRRTCGSIMARLHRS